MLALTPLLPLPGRRRDLVDQRNAQWVARLHYDARCLVHSVHLHHHQLLALYCHEDTVSSSRT